MTAHTLQREQERSGRLRQELQETEEKLEQLADKHEKVTSFRHDCMQAMSRVDLLMGVGSFLLLFEWGLRN